MNYRRGANHPSWKGGKRYTSTGYHKTLLPNHPRADYWGYVNNHLLVEEQYLSILFDEPIFIPKPYVIHHINGNKDDNSLINMQLLLQSDHLRIHRLDKHKDTSDRQCFDCGSLTTTMHKPNHINKTPYPHWHHLPTDKVNWYCHNCYSKRRQLRSL